MDKKSNNHQKSTAIFTLPRARLYIVGNLPDEIFDRTIFDGEENVRDKWKEVETKKE
jgi:hypothetical protein